MVVLHYTAMRRCGDALDRLCDPAHEVSAHYLISEHGAVFALVPEEARAWHAGAGSWGGAADVNSRSIGIELANPGDAPFAAPQMAALEDLLGEVMQRHAIPPERVIGHSDMAPARKTDPGPRFDWRRLALQRLSVWPAPDGREGRKSASPAAEATEEVFLRDAAAFGYDPAAGCATLLAAFRLRFRPWAEGPLSAADVADLRDLARRFPVDRGEGRA